MTLKQLRKDKKLTQAECAKLLGIPLRTYQNYETDITKSDTMKYEFMMQKLNEYGIVDETHGILSVTQIKDICSEVFANYDVEYCYLFGSYAKGKAREESDVDLLVSADVKGLKFYGFVEKIKNTLQKKVDVLDINQLKENMDLLNEILRDGIKIYG